ncbi:MAG: two-component regulator propeller domain-containing protein [Crocinitomicaceae bacterium]|nr:SpoIIE family protein phosphatase [Crocinitomicaceae bacterium]
MNLKGRFPILILALVLLIFSCNGKKDELTDENEHVITDLLSEDIETGVPLPFKPFEIDPDSIQPPTIVKAGEPYYQKAHQNIHAVDQPIIKLISSSLPTFTIGHDSIKEPDIYEAKGVEKRSGYNEPQLSSKFDFNDAASYNIQGIDVDQGLSSSYVIDILEDKRGNLWFSTWFAGVTMYNGRSFIMFDEEKGMLSNYVWSMYEDQKGNIWFGTDGGGMCMYNGESFTDYNLESGIPSGLIKDITGDEQGNIWMATGDGLCKFDGEQFYLFGPKQGMSGSVALSVTIGNSGEIWVGLDGGGINKFDGESFTHYTEREGLISNWVTSLYMDSEDNLWIATLDSGVCMYDGYSFITYQEEMGLPNNAVNCILEDRHGNMWFGTEGGGATMFNRFEFKNFTSREGMSNNLIWSLLEDSYGNIWFGSFGAGANIYNERSFENYSEYQGLSDHIVRHIIQDKRGFMWFASNNGISKYNGKEFWHYNTDQGLAMNIVRVILEDTKGDLWLGYNGGGVSRFDGKNFYHYTTENGLSGDFIMSIFEDSKGNIWFGTFGDGVTKFDGTKFSHFTTNQGLSNNTVHAILEDEEGKIYLGTKGGGLDIYDGENIVHVTRDQGLSDNSIISMIVSWDGSIWAGSEGFGINHILEDTIISYSLPGSNSHNIIWSIVEDNNGELWLGTERGLNNFYLDDSLGEVITNYGKPDGLKGSDFYPSSACLDDENRIWWGTGKSLAMLDLNKYEQQQKAPIVQITDIRLEQTFVDFRRLRDSLEAGYKPKLPGNSEISLSSIKFTDVSPFTNCPEQLELPYYLNHITFSFSGIDWSAPHKVEYQYMLQGLDDGWRPITDENRAVYSYVEPGEYIFKVRAKGVSNVWSDIKSYPVIIHPPWWTTWLAKGLYVILGALSIFIFIRIRTTRLLQHQRQLEDVVKMRTREVVQQKEIVEHKNMEITASITYAKRIQSAILPSQHLIDQHLKESFFIYMPKDIVAGDFYWMDVIEDEILLAAADCTGHGVPGAMVSVVCNNALNRTVREFLLRSPGEILNKVRDLVIETFQTTGEEVKDGMDIALVSLNPKTLELKFAGANNNLYLVRNGEIEEISADRMPIGSYVVKKDFNEHTFKLQKGDVFYIFTDGYADQFGGPKGKKFKYSTFKKVLYDNKDLPLAQQAEILRSTLNSWMGDYEQIDDICVIGVKV